MPASPFTTRRGGLMVALRVTPGARCDSIDGLFIEAGGGVVLKARVTAKPQSGRANAALIELLARQWGASKTAFDVVAERAGHRKKVCLAGDAEAWRAGLEQWLKDMGKTNVRSKNY